MRAADLEVERLGEGAPVLFVPAAADSISPLDFVRMFRFGANSARETPSELQEPLRRGAERTTLEGRGPQRPRDRRPVQPGSGEIPGHARAR